MRSSELATSHTQQAIQQPIQQRVRMLSAAVLPNPRHLWRGFFVAFYYYFFGYRLTPARAGARTMLD